MKNSNLEKLLSVSSEIMDEFRCTIVSLVVSPDGVRLISRLDSKETVLLFLGSFSEIKLLSEKHRKIISDLFIEIYAGDENEK